MEDVNQQIVYARFGGGTRSLVLPPAGAEVMPGIRWGAADEVFTPAFWSSQVWMRSDELDRRKSRLGRTVQEEAAACLLGGYGIPAEVGMAAFRRLQGDARVWDSPDSALIEGLLRAPLQVSGRPVRYRFVRQKSAFVASAIRDLSRMRLPREHRDFRNALLELRGVGPKTASWITRNWLESDEVAIIDVHVLRLCRWLGVFSRDSTPDQYFELESQFLDFSRALDVRASRLDHVIWAVVRRIGQNLH